MILARKKLRGEDFKFNSNLGPVSKQKKKEDGEEVVAQEIFTGYYRTRELLPGTKQNEKKKKPTQLQPITLLTEIPWLLLSLLDTTMAGEAG